MNTIGDRIIFLREKNNISQRKLAKDLGLSSGNISSYENNKRIPSTETVIALANYFNISTDWILKGESQVNNYNITPNKEMTLNENLESYNKFDPLVEESLKDDPELYSFWQTMMDREDLKLLFKKSKPLKPKTVKQIIAWIKAVEDAEAQED